MTTHTAMVMTEQIVQSPFTGALLSASSRIAGIQNEEGGLMNA